MLHVESLILFVFAVTGSELQSEVENLALRLFYMENAKEDVRSDISIMKRAAEKAETEVSKAETRKQKQASVLPVKLTDDNRRVSSIIFVFKDCQISYWYMYSLNISHF